MTDQRVFYVLLLRKASGVLNDGFEYWAEQLPDVGDEIELAPPADFRPTRLSRQSCGRS